MATYILKRKSFTARPRPIIAMPKSRVAYNEFGKIAQSARNRQLINKYKFNKNYNNKRNDNKKS